MIPGSDTHTKRDSKLYSGSFSRGRTLKKTSHHSVPHEHTLQVFRQQPERVLPQVKALAPGVSPASKENSALKWQTTGITKRKTRKDLLPIAGGRAVTTMVRISLPEQSPKKRSGETEEFLESTATLSPGNSPDFIKPKSGRTQHTGTGS